MMPACSVSVYFIQSLVKLRNRIVTEPQAVCAREKLKDGKT